MDRIDNDALTQLARKYICWKTPQEAIALLGRVIAQVMNMGDYADVQKLANQIGDEVFRNVLLNAQAGQFSHRS